ncbi:MAG TPA: esterase-like activity of phytase family protein [Vicinamibacteria bacterium]
MGRKPRIVLVFALLSSACRRNEPVGPVPPPLEITFVASALLPLSSEGESLEVGGISAVSHEGENGAWLALSDARVSSRFYEMAVSLDGSTLSVTPRRAVALENADPLDTEGMVKSPWGTLLVSTEGDGDKEPVLQPKLLEFDREGALVRSFPIPEKFLVSGSPPEKGVRDNLAFESLALSLEGDKVFVGVEGTLYQDGAVAGVDSIGFSRILVFAVKGNDLSETAEYVYPMGPFIPAADFAEQEVSGGLVELVSLGGTRLLALERIFIRELSGEKRDRNQSRIFSVDLSSASNVMSDESLEVSRDWRPVTKELVLDLDDVVDRLPREYPRLDNLEAMGLGPELPGGGRALLLASDDNFHSRQRTQFLLFRLKGV